MKYNILVVGSNGYIGLNLENKLESYIKNGYDLDVKYVDINATKENHIKDDFINLTDDYLKTVDVCVFLAAISGIELCNNKSEETIEENLLKPLSFFEKLKKYNTHIIFASSCAAAKPESSLYAFTKRSLEKWLIDNINKNKRSIFRFSNVFGGIGFENKTSVIAKFKNAINDNKDLIINGNGKQKRNFIHVYLICNHICDEFLGNKDENSIIELGLSKVYSILDIALMFKEYHNSKIQFNEDGFVGILDVNPIDIKLKTDNLTLESYSLENYIKSHGFSL